MAIPLLPSPDELKPYVLNGLLKGVWDAHYESTYQRLKWTLSNATALRIFACLSLLIALAQSQCWCLLRYTIARYTPSLRLPGDPSPDPLLKLSQSEAIWSVVPVLSRWTLWLFDGIRRLLRTGSRPDARLPRTADDELIELPSIGSSVIQVLPRRTLWLDDRTRRLGSWLHARFSRTAYHEPVESPFFGLASILNGTFFTVLQFLCPYWLTEGALSAPIVKSKSTKECLNSTKEKHSWDITNRKTRGDEIFQQCRDNLNAGCDGQYFISEPKIAKTRLSTCPFPGDICLGDSAPFEITHQNISAFEMGVNSRSALTMNHRLTCAPVSPDPFLFEYNQGSLIYVANLPRDGQRAMPLNDVSLTLATTNGPNKFSNESSGEMAQRIGGVRLDVLPRFRAGVAFSPDHPPLELNPALQRDDGQSFLIIYRAGSAYYSQIIDDPFFSAHNIAAVFPDHGFSTAYGADAEATALGCVEQFQFCFTPSKLLQWCTDWGTRHAQFGAMANYLIAQYRGPHDGDPFDNLENWSDQFGWAYSEMLASFKLAPAAVAIYDYVAIRIDILKMVPLIQRIPMAKEYRWIDDTREQWVLEAETWFMKAWLSGLLSIQDGALYALSDFNAGFSDEFLMKWKLCGRILFRDKDFTNVNRIGLGTLVASLTLLCLAGNRIDTLHRVWRECASKLRVTWVKISLFVGELYEGTRKKTPSPNQTVWFRSQPKTVGDISLLFQLLSRRGPRYGSGGRRHPRVAPTSDANYRTVY